MGDGAEQRRGGSVTWRRDGAQWSLRCSSWVGSCLVRGAVLFVFWIKNVSLPSGIITRVTTDSTVATLTSQSSLQKLK
jgi:hypothetical protein